MKYSELRTRNDCLKILSDARWADGFYCPKCTYKDKSNIITDRGLSCCKNCRTQISPTSGTIFQDVRRLPEWFHIIETLLGDQDGLSHADLKSQFSDFDKKAILKCHNKIRDIFEDIEKPALQGRIFVCCRFVGSDQERKSERRKRPLIALAAELDDNISVKRIKLEYLLDNNGHVFFHRLIDDINDYIGRMLYAQDISEEKKEEALEVCDARMQVINTEMTQAMNNFINNVIIAGQSTVLYDPDYHKNESLTLQGTPHIFVQQFHDDINDIFEKLDSYLNKCRVAPNSKNSKKCFSEFVFSKNHGSLTTSDKFELFIKKAVCK